MKSQVVRLHKAEIVFYDLLRLPCWFYTGDDFVWCKTPFISSVRWLQYFYAEICLNQYKSPFVYSICIAKGDYAQFTVK